MITPSQAVFSTTLTIDRVIGTHSGSFTSTAPTPGGTTTVTDVYNTNIAETTLYTGIYSVDGGTTWTPLHGETKHADNLGSIFVGGASRANTFTITTSNSRNAGAGSNGPSYTVLYKVALIAKPDQGDIEPQPIGSNTYFDSRLNYQKISLDDYRAVTAGFNVSQAHNAGGVPKVRVWLEVAGVLRSKGFYSAAVVSMDSTNVTCNWSAYALGGTLYTRAYYHEQ